MYHTFLEYLQNPKYILILNYSKGFDDSMEIFAVLGVLFAVNQAEGIITTLQILKFINSTSRGKGEMT